MASQASSHDDLGPAPEWDDNEMALEFPLRASTINAAQYAVMTLVRQHAPSLRAAEDLRLLLDEVIGRAPADDPSARVILSISTSPEMVRGSIEVRPVRAALTDRHVRGLADEISIRTHGSRMVVEFTTAWRQRD